MPRLASPTAARRWISAHAEPWPAEETLERALAGAELVGLGGTTRSAHELAGHQRDTIMVLVERLGFRSIVLEEDWTLCLALDAYVRLGAPDPRATLMQARPFWRSEELLETVEWLRSFNLDGPEEPVRVIGLNADTTRAVAHDRVMAYMNQVAPGRRAEVEVLLATLRPGEDIGEHIRWYRGEADPRPFLRRARLAHDLVAATAADAPGRELALRHARAIVDFCEYHSRSRPDVLAYAAPRFAQDLLWWRAHTGHRIVYWGGIAHTADGATRALSEPACVGASTGHLLRAHLGDRYRSVGFTFTGGDVGQPVPAAADGFAEALLGDDDLPEAYALDVRATDDGPRLPAWFRGPARIRSVGPDYDAARDPDLWMAGGTLSEWFDVLVHTREVTPITTLEPLAAGAWEATARA